MRESESDGEQRSSQVRWLRDRCVISVLTLADRLKISSN